MTRDNNDIEMDGESVKDGYVDARDQPALAPKGMNWRYYSGLILLHSFFSRFCRSPIPRGVLVGMIALVWSSVTFGGAIHDAALDGDLEKVKSLLKANPDLVNSKNKNGRTPLYLAASKGHKDVAELLLANKAQVDAKDNFDITPLSIAVEGGYKDIAVLLLAHKADVNGKDWMGFTPLHEAATFGYKDIAVLLLANHAEINATNKRGWTPLHNAVASGTKNVNGRKEVVALLLANKADYNVYDAAAGSDLEKVKSLVQANPGLIFSKDQDNGLTPLHWAAWYGHKNVAAWLLANKADVNAKDDNGMSPLHRAAIPPGHKEVIELLLANKADVNAKDDNGWTPLHWMSGNGDPDIEKLLRQHGGHE